MLHRSGLRQEFIPKLERKRAGPMQLLNWLDGRKTYIVALIGMLGGFYCLVARIVPPAEALAFITAMAGMATTRQAISKGQQ